MHRSADERINMAFPTTHPALARALAAQGYGEPTPVQAEAIPTESFLATFFVWRLLNAFADLAQSSILAPLCYPASFPLFSLLFLNNGGLV